MKIFAPSFLCLFMFFSFAAIAQENPEGTVLNTLNNQMTEVFENNNSYQTYKVIPKNQLNTLRKNILDSVSELKTTILDQQNNLSARKKTIDSLDVELHNVKEELQISREREDGISVLGTLTSKAVYNTVLWSIILVLLVISGFFFYRFSSSHSIIREGRKKVEELETENEELRRNHLEREQKLRRKLQDEINKNKG